MSDLPPLQEFEPVWLGKDTLSAHHADLLWRSFGKVVRVEYPSPKTNDCWRLTAQGWCGYLPLGDGVGLELRPKVEVGNVWKMLDYAYFTEIKLFEDEFHCEAVEELVERLAAELARRVMQRARRGLYRTYVGESGRLSCVRGRIDMNKAMRTPWVPEPYCRFQTHTSDIEDNRILTWTLDRIARSGVCHDQNYKHEGAALSLVRQAYRTMLGATQLTSFTGRDCRMRRYNRLNSDYAVLHALCRFFLDHLSPGLKPNELDGATMLPFLIPMDRLFQDYVAMWLHRNLDEWQVSRQEQVDLDHGNQHFDIDIVLYDSHQNARCVIDTKYKAPKSGLASSADIAQVIAYAVAKQCSEAVLLFPAELERPLDITVSGIRVRALTFPMNQRPKVAGPYFLRQLNLASLGKSDRRHTLMASASQTQVAVGIHS